MTEKDLYNKFLSTHDPHDFKIWRAPVFKRMRWDIFNIFDLILITPIDNSISFIQLTTISNLSHRRNKIKEHFKRILNYVIPNSYIFAWDDKNNKWKVEEIKDTNFIYNGAI